MSIALADIGGILKPVGDVIDSLHTSAEEKLEAKGRLVEATATLTMNALEYERSVFEMQAKVLTAEINSKHWLPSNWRPVTMLSFVFMMIWNWVVAPRFGQEPIVYPEWVGDAFKIGLGGYVVGRSAEKITKTISLNSALLKMPGSERKELRQYRKMLKKAQTPEERERILDLIEQAD